MKKICISLSVAVLATAVFFACSDKTDPNDCNETGSCEQPGGGTGNLGSSSSNNPGGNPSVNECEGYVPPSPPPVTGGTGNCIPPPGQGVPPNGKETCITVNNKCYKCNPDRGDDCLNTWLWDGTQVQTEYWFTEVPCGGSGGAVVASLNCANVPSAGAVGQPINAPAVTCGTASVSSYNIAWASSPAINWASPVAGAYNNIKATATSGNCKCQTANCAGTITVAAATALSSSSTGGGGASSNSGGSPSYTPTTPGTATAVTTQYWDACKPSCGWGGKGGLQANSCNISGANIGHNDMDKSACDGGTAFACMNQAPWKVGNVSFGYVAVNDGACGDCYQLDFPNGEVMVVMKSNIGSINGKFDIMIPGGGVGDFDALTRQVQQSGISSPNMGERYGGFRGACGWSGAGVANCVKQKCDDVFKNLPDLKAGCNWYVSTLGNSDASFDNPTVKYKKVTCPKELTDRY